MTESEIRISTTLALESILLSDVSFTFPRIVGILWARVGVVVKKINIHNGRQHTLNLANLICGVLDGQISDGISKVFFVVVKLFKMLRGYTVLTAASDVLNMEVSFFRALLIWRSTSAHFDLLSLSRRTMRIVRSKSISKHQPITMRVNFYIFSIVRCTWRQVGALYTYSLPCFVQATG